MSEIAKCPVCGNPHVEMLDENIEVSGASCCGATFTTIKAWNQYAAAMELAGSEVNRAETIKQTDSDEEIHAAHNEQQDALKRVLEVFGGGE